MPLPGRLILGVLPTHNPHIMGLPDAIQDLVGKYSVTGVLKERLDFELARAAASREDAAKEIAALISENASLRTENASLKSKLQSIETERNNLRHELNALKQLTPATELDIGAEVTLASLMNSPAGVRLRDLAEGTSLRITTDDVLVWIHEFKESCLVEDIVIDGSPGFRLTQAGRRFARDYFARNR